MLLGVTKHEENICTSIVVYHSYLLKKTIVEDDSIVIFSIFRKKNDTNVDGLSLSGSPHHRITEIKAVPMCRSPFTKAQGRKIVTKVFSKRKLERKLPSSFELHL